MISDGCVLCFGGMKPRIIALIALGASVFEFIFLMWGLGGNKTIHASASALYHAGFVFMIISYFVLFAIFIITVYRDGNHSTVLNDVGKILCMATMIPLLIGTIFIFIASCIYMDDYRKYGKGKSSDSIDLDDLFGLRALSVLPGKYWGAAIVPFIFLILTSVLIVFCLNALYSIFNKNIYSSISEAKAGKNNQVAVNVDINNNNPTPGSFNNNPNLNNNNNQVINNPMNPQEMNYGQNYGSSSYMN